MIQSLLPRLEAARTAYYNSTPIMTDAEYDALEDELRRLDPNHPFLAGVGAAPTANGWPKVKHVIRMGSLNKAQTADDLKDWHRGCATSLSNLIVMTKLDGISLALRYHQRRLVQAVTRGDGTVGEDITRNALLMRNVVKYLPPTLGGKPTPDDVDVRGEVVCRKSDFALYFKGESNPRNTASGTAKRQTAHEKCAHLTFIAYQCLPNGVGLPTKQEELDALTAAGFLVPQWSQAKDIPTVVTVYNQYVASVRASLDYDIDGLVIEFDALQLRESLGDLNGRPKGAIAFKFPHDEQPTVLRDVEWQVGNSGRITPVAIFDEILLGGRKITRASLATVRQVDQMRLSKGCRILVSLRNDVIPRVESNLDEGIRND